MADSGTFKWFDQSKGYGFITPEDGSSDVFVHVSSVRRSGLASLADGQRVGCEVVMNRRSRKIAAERLTAL